MQLKDLIFELCAVPSVSGFEKRGTQRLLEILGDKLEFVSVDGVGNHIFRKCCGRQNAPKIMLDAHFDEIGMIVTDITEGGFLHVAPLGGIDAAIMQAADVIIYGKEPIRGVICSTPPHLRVDDELPEVDALMIDTGLSKERASEIISIGSPVGFAPVYGELLGQRLVGKSFDDKACAACALFALINAPASSLAGDVYILLSCTEETSRLGGVTAGAFLLSPDYAMVIDVNLARVPDTKSFETVVLGKGPSISVSAATDVPLTRATQRLCEQKGIAHQMIAAPSSTGTNATSVNLTREGIPVVDIGLPLAYMHTYNELIDLNDCNTLCSLISEFICSEEIAEQMRCLEG